MDRTGDKAGPRELMAADAQPSASKWRCGADGALEQSRTGVNSYLESPGWKLASPGRTEFFTGAPAPDRGGVPHHEPVEHRIAGELGDRRGLSEISMARLTDFDACLGELVLLIRTARGRAAEHGSGSRSKKSTASPSGWQCSISSSPCNSRPPSPAAPLLPWSATTMRSSWPLRLPPNAEMQRRNGWSRPGSATMGAVRTSTALLMIAWMVDESHRQGPPGSPASGPCGRDALHKNSATPSKASTPPSHRFFGRAMSSSSAG